MHSIVIISEHVVCCKDLWARRDQDTQVLILSITIEFYILLKADYEKKYHSLGEPLRDQ